MNHVDIVYYAKHVLVYIALIAICANVKLIEFIKYKNINKTDLRTIRSLKSNQFQIG
jgi:hypothetical protein